MFTVRKFSHEESAFVVGHLQNTDLFLVTNLFADDLGFFRRFGLLLRNDRELAQQWLAGL